MAKETNAERLQRENEIDDLMEGLDDPEMHQSQKELEDAALDELVNAVTSAPTSQPMHTPRPAPQRSEDSRQQHPLPHPPQALSLPDDIQSEISDEELEEGGMQRVTAWVRGGLPSGNAKRVQKSRDAAAKGANGPPRKQLNVTAPADKDAREVLKVISAALVDGEVTPDDLRTNLRSLIEAFSAD